MGLWEQGGLRVFSGDTDPLQQLLGSVVTGPWELGGLRSSVMAETFFDFAKIRWVEGLWEQGGLRVFKGGTDYLLHLLGSVVTGPWEQGGFRVFSGGTDPLKHGSLRTGRFESLQWWQRPSDQVCHGSLKNCVLYLYPSCHFCSPIVFWVMWSQTNKPSLPASSSPPIWGTVRSTINRFK